MTDIMHLEPADEYVLTDPEAVKIFFDPLRRRIVQTLVKEPRTVGQIAEILDLDFRKLYYHIKLLERHNLIRLVERQTISGAVEEKYYRVTAYEFVVDRGLLRLSGEGFSAVDAMLDNLRKDIQEGARNGTIDTKATAPDPAAILMRQTFARLTEEDAKQFYELLLDLILTFTMSENDDDPDAQHYNLTVSLHPSSTMDDDQPMG